MQFLATAADSEPWTPLNNAAARKAARELTRWGLDSIAPSALRAALDDIAERTLAVYVQADREHDMRLQSAAHRARLDVYRAERNAQYVARSSAGKLLRRAIDSAGAVPPATDRPRVETWTSATAAGVRGHGHGTDEATTDALRHLLREALERASWPAELVDKVTAFVADAAAA
ncbi:hypothetical protein [Demequina lutea]|uniref:Uncharacterized protein n=1 Tax=Demequina lutea TaxID=431489 RepID=A0A7Y9ZC75_9MICO|nr:hypothetical protein [Demequina lutea]NYI41305.1 hypothetical protein [Demequina lutea]